MAKVATVAVVGRTNAGKSTLVNALVGEKVSIVSPVEQTTRNMVRGIVADPRGQLVLLDTPGLHKAIGNLGRALNRIARRTAAGADVACVVFDASCEPQMEDLGWMARVAKEKPPKALFALNKSDLAGFRREAFEAAWRETPGSAETQVSWTCCSAATPGGEAPVLDALFALADEGEPLFPDDVATDYPRRFAIADAIREKYIARLYRELPHELGVVVREISETARGWEIEAVALVNRKSQKPIAIGRGAENVKAVRKAAGKEISEMFGVKASLSLKVEVSPGWMNDPRLMAAMGYC